MSNFIKLKGETIVAIDISADDDMIKFNTLSGKSYCMDHSQGCCEVVYIEDICGDLSDIIGSPDIKAEEVTRDMTDEEAIDGYGVWTFYKIETIKGGVTIRWNGQSNGYYSVSVDFWEMVQ